MPTQQHSYLKLQHFKNFFSKQDKQNNVFNAANGLTYEEIIKQEIPESKTANKVSQALILKENSATTTPGEEFSQASFRKIVIHFPVNISTEFQPLSKTISPTNKLKDNETPSELLTVQIRLLSMNNTENTLVYSAKRKSGAILINPKIDFLPLQALVDEFGFSIKTFHGRDWFDIKKKNYPTINIVLYCFSGKESIFKLFRRYTLAEAKNTHKPGEPGLQNLLKKVRSGFLNESKSYLHAGSKSWINQSIELPYLLIGPNLSTDSNNQKFKVSIEIIDVCAIHGSDKKLSEIACTVEVPYQTKIKDEEDENLQAIYDNEWETFLEYAKAKCIYHEILKNYHDKMQRIYHELNIPDNRFKPPKSTIGATVKNLLESAVIHRVQQANPDLNDETIKGLVKLGSVKLIKEKIARILAEKFRDENDDTSQIKKLNKTNQMLLLTKVVGGRTECGRPLHIAEKHKNEVICDSDIKQAYPSVLKYSQMPLGHFQIVQDISLKEYIERHRQLGKVAKNLELVYVTVESQGLLGLKEELPESQNLIPSVTFLPSKKFNQPDNTNDTETRIYTHEIFQGPFTSSTFEWLDNVATPKLRKYIKEKAKVVVGGYYNTEKFVPLEDLGKHLEHFNEQQQWTKVELGPLIVNELIDKRKNFLKRSQGGSDETEAMNTLLKLMNNTIYGALCNDNFDICNPIVANNVTSDIRLMVWCMETALGGFQTITDGVSWCLNRVLVGRDKRYKHQPLNSLHHLVHRLPCTKSEERLAQGWNWSPIGTARRYEWRDADVLEYPCQSSSKPIEYCQEYNNEGKPKSHCLLQRLDNKLIPQHIQDCFPQLRDFIKLFEIESKGLYTNIFIDGKANYVLTPPKSYPVPDNEPIIKRRSHTTKRGEARKVFKQYYLKDLSQNPECVPIPMPYIDYELVSCGDYQKRYESNYQYSILIPGDYEPKVKSFQAFQLYQFTFRTRAQYESFRTEHEKARKKYGLSAERYNKPFRDKGAVEDWHINYKQMIEEYDKALCPRNSKKGSQGKPYKTYREYQNSKNRSRSRKSGSLSAKKPKEEKEKLNQEVRRLFDYEPSYIEELLPRFNDSLTDREYGSDGEDRLP